MRITQMTKSYHTLPHRTFPFFVCSKYTTVLSLKAMGMVIFDLLPSFKDTLLITKHLYDPAKNLFVFIVELVSIGTIVFLVSKGFGFLIFDLPADNSLI